MRKINYAAVKQHLYFAQLHLEQAGRAADAEASGGVQLGYVSSAWFHLWAASQKLPQVIAINYGESGFHGSIQELQEKLQDMGIQSPECALVAPVMNDPSSFLQTIEKKIMEAITLKAISNVSVGFNIGGGGGDIPVQQENDEIGITETQSAIESFRSMIEDLSSHGDEN